MPDLPLTESGRQVAGRLRERLPGTEFGVVHTSRRRRAVDTAELAGFGHAQGYGDLVEWRYGAYEGITAAEIRETVRGWTVPCPRRPVARGCSPVQLLTYPSTPHPVRASTRPGEHASRRTSSGPNQPASSASSAARTADRSTPSSGRQR